MRATNYISLVLACLSSATSAAQQKENIEKPAEWAPNSPSTTLSIKPTGSAKKSELEALQDGELGTMNLPQQMPQTITNKTSSFPSQRQRKPSTIISNGDFSTGDSSSWRIDSPATPGAWSATVKPASGPGAVASKPVMELNVPVDSYLMMYQDLQDTVAGTSYTLDFDYKFHNQCAQGSSLYWGAVSTEDLVDFEGDIDLEAGWVDSWRTFSKRLTSSTNGMSLYLYFMTKKAGGCTFSVDNISLA